ncbi:cation diffusion facilitator family transporter [Virgibacillus sp. 179-BFC.A HS]|uniref:Cation diffusion facilitator family transporter n=1 Tax=Tigheibacillus jepli TaxID=3035914 RepID=A0ABU5CIX1_9BACI|nr:cation diffusion facilitator family transporter [Virgibacillus sp. 179-BFC.A HS]MDY0406269.1 cation diffusion facilitator family transporter [Virgibacillus sp. 179-BFC.A HS]
MNHTEEMKRGEKGAIISIIAYLILALAKLTIGYLGNSDALRADGLNNSTDVIASVAILVGLKISRKPPDKEHRYGHYRAETIASLFAAFIMVAVGIQVIIDTVQKIFSHDNLQPSMLTAWTALGAAAVMFIVYAFNLSLAKKINSSALHAAAQDNKSDALVSIGAFIGIIGANFGVYWLDPFAGLAVGVIICHTAWDIFKDSTRTLTDGFDEQKLEKIRNSVSTVDQVKKVKDIKGRILGNQDFVDITILVDPSLNVIESHAITENIEKLLKEKHGITYSQIHIEPYQ